jgi:hypothetical protein
MAKTSILARATDKRSSLRHLPVAPGDPAPTFLASKHVFYRAAISITCRVIWYVDGRLSGTLLPFEKDFEGPV